MYSIYVSHHTYFIKLLIPELIGRETQTERQDKIKAQRGLQRQEELNSRCVWLEQNTKELSVIVNMIQNSDISKDQTINDESKHVNNVWLVLL